MKRLNLAAFFVATTFAAVTAIAATPVTAPSMPNDLPTAWTKDYKASCTKPDKIVIAITAYAKNDDSKAIVLVTKNGTLVALYEVTDEYNTVSVEQSDGTWLRYNRPTEESDATAAIKNMIGLSPPEWRECAR